MIISILTIALLGVGVRPEYDATEISKASIAQHEDFYVEPLSTCIVPDKDGYLPSDCFVQSWRKGYLVTTDEDWHNEQQGLYWVSRWIDKLKRTQRNIFLRPVVVMPGTRLVLNHSQLKFFSAYRRQCPGCVEIGRVGGTFAQAVALKIGFMNHARLLDNVPLNWYDSVVDVGFNEWSVARPLTEVLSALWKDSVAVLSEFLSPSPTRCTPARSLPLCASTAPMPPMLM